MAPQRIILLGCSKSKSSEFQGADGKVQASKLYASSPIKRRQYAHLKRRSSASDFDWWILSAKYGLVDPDATLEPYDCYLPQCPPYYQKKWAVRVANSLLEAYNPSSPADLVVEIHAGAVYTSLLSEVLAPFVSVIETPLAGIPILYWNAMYQVWTQRQKYAESLQDCRNELEWGTTSTKEFITLIINAARKG